MNDNSLVSDTRTFHQFTQNLSHFLLNQYIFVVISTDRKYFTNTIFVDKSFWAKFFTLTKLNIPEQLTVVVDGLQYNSGANTWVIQFNTTSLLNDSRCSAYTTIGTDNLSIITVSHVYKSVVWLERELSDFTGINFVGLVDTRRLLLDYFEEKAVWQTHINNDKNFNETLYEVTLSY